MKLSLALSSTDLVRSLPRRQGYMSTDKTTYEAWFSLDDFENEFQFQLQGYASAGETVNPDGHNQA